MSLLGLQAALLLLVEHAHPHSCVPESTTVVKIKLQFTHPSFTSPILHLEKTLWSHTDWSNNMTIGHTSAGVVIAQTLQDKATLCRLGAPFTGIPSKCQQWPVSHGCQDTTE